MNIKTGYDKLYAKWKEELQNENLSLITKEEFNQYKKYHTTIKKYQINDKDPVKIQILKVFRNNFDYVFNDLLQLRREKILSAAFSLIKINVKRLLEPEKLLYQSVVAAIKGYDKVLTHALLEETLESSISTENERENKITIENYDNKEDTKIKNDNKPYIENDEDLHISSISEDKNELEINYTLIRFLKKTPALMGMDLKKYGPFEKEDVVFLPSKNAKILIAEEIADQIIF